MIAVGLVAAVIGGLGAGIAVSAGHGPTLGGGRQEAAPPNQINLHGTVQDIVVPGQCLSSYDSIVASLSGLEIVIYEDPSGQVGLGSTVGGLAVARHVAVLPGGAGLPHERGGWCVAEERYSLVVPYRAQYWFGTIGGPTGAKVIHGPFTYQDFARNAFDFNLNIYTGGTF